MEEREEPTFGELLRCNLRIVGVALVVLVLAYALWRGLAVLFPELAWLQFRPS